MTSDLSAPDLLHAIGTALFGSQWQSDLAACLGVSDRTVRRWVSGEHQPQPGVWSDLERLLKIRAEAQWRLRRVVQERGYRMRHEFVPSPDCAEEGETPAESEEEVREMYPWATEIIEVASGWHAFESPEDAAAWRERN